MVNNSSLTTLRSMIRGYVAIVVATVAALAVLSSAAPHQATDHAWGHAVIVLVFAAILPLRARSATRGNRSGLRAVGLISSALFLVNVVEGLIPGFLPPWMRVESFAIAALMLAIVGLVIRVAVVAPKPSTDDLAAH